MSAPSRLPEKNPLPAGFLDRLADRFALTRDAKGTTWAVVAILNDPRPWGASAVLDQALLDIYGR